MDKKIRSAAVVLSAGSGKRMGTGVKKQYMLIGGKPVIYYSLDAFEKSDVEEIVLVVGADDIEDVRENIIDKFGFKKVSAIVAGGKERYNSVYNGLRAVSKDTDVVMVHDGARPFISASLINECISRGFEDEACVVAVRSKDTVRLCDDNGIAIATPDRDEVWQMQTPQVFLYDRAMAAFDKLFENEDYIIKEGINITDDAMVVEYFEGIPIKMIEGSYSNIKITTPDDIPFAESIISVSAG